MRRESHVRFYEGGGVRLPSATRLVIGFERQDDAAAVMDVLPKRMAKYGLTLHPEKTRLFAFSPPNDGDDDQGGATFDFLGFTVHWQRTLGGGWRMGCKTRRARISRAIKAATDWCRGHRHLPVKVQHTILTRKLDGHIRYFGVNGNARSLHVVVDGVKSAWRKWLNRRSQRSRMTWRRYAALMAALPLPRPRIVVQLWARRP